MTDLPASSIALFDGRGQAFGVLRLVRTSDEALKGDCIFDIEPLAEDARSEVRWLFKRRYQRASEHKWKLSGDGKLTVHGGDFRVVFAPREEEGDLLAQPPAPKVTGRWG